MKSKAWAYFWWFSGFFGLNIHAFYCNRPYAIALPIYYLACFFLMGEKNGWIFSFLYCLFFFAQLFLIPTWVKEANEKETQVQIDLIAQGIRKARDEDAINN
jgi:hypothetical protein